MEEVDVVVDEVTWIFRPITCDENMTHKKFTSVSQPGEKTANPLNCLSDVDDCRLIMMVLVVTLMRVSQIRC